MTGLKDIRQPPKDDEPGPAARAAEDVMLRVARESRKFWTPPAPPPALADAIGQAIARHESASVAELRRELEDLKARLSDAEPGPTAELPQGQATAPEKRTAQRRAILSRIIAALRELDPALNPAAMPGRMVDFLTLCQAVDHHLFTIELDTFDKARKGLCQFTQGARATDYYREKLPAVRAKLG